MLDRRQFLQTSALAGAIFRREVKAEGRSRIKVGTSPASWGIWFAQDPLQIPWRRFLDEVAEAGYEFLELGPYGYLLKDATRLRGALKERGLKICAGLVRGCLSERSAWLNLEKTVVEMGELLSSLEADFLLLASNNLRGLFGICDLSRASRADQEGWNRLIEVIHKTADLAHHRLGLKLVFQHSLETHVDYPDQVEQLLEQTDPARVSLCFDTGHFAYRMGDPVSFIRRHHSRISIIRLKNSDGVLNKTHPREGFSLINAVGKGTFSELEKGSVDVSSLAQTLREIGYAKWVIVEQEMYPAPFDKPLPAAKRSRAYLKGIGIG